MSAQATQPAPSAPAPAQASAAPVLPIPSASGLRANVDQLTQQIAKLQGGAR